MKNTKPILKNKESPTFDEIIKYDRYARRLQSQAVFFIFKSAKGQIP